MTLRLNGWNMLKTSLKLEFFSRHALRILFGLPHEFLRHGYPTKLKVPTMAHLACIPPGHLEWKVWKLQALAPFEIMLCRVYRTLFMTFHMNFLTVLIVFDSGCSQSLTSTSSRCSSFHQAAPQDGLFGHVAAGFSGISSNCSCLKVDMRNSIVTLPATMVLLEENWPSPSSWQTSGKQRTSKTTKWACKDVSKTWGIHISTEDRSCKVYRLQPCKKTCAKHWRYMYSTLVFSKHCRVNSGPWKSPMFIFHVQDESFPSYHPTTSSLEKRQKLSSRMLAA